MQQALLKLLHFQQGEDPEMQTMDSPVEHTYAINIPMPADGGRASRRMDHAKYRELRKTLEAHQLSQDAAATVPREELSGSVPLARNYIGNPVDQRFFEQCSETVKTEMLERLAPHLASLGTHKNGTWAAQKIIDCVRTEEQQDLITTHMQPYVPSLLLDQFGNYVVQCVLPLVFPRLILLWTPWWIDAGKLPKVVLVLAACVRVWSTLACLGSTLSVWLWRSFCTVSHSRLRPMAHSCLHGFLNRQACQVSLSLSPHALYRTCRCCVHTSWHQASCCAS